MILFNNYTLINPRKNNDISLYSGLFEKSPTVLRREAIFWTPYSECECFYVQWIKIPRSVLIRTLEFPLLLIQWLNGFSLIKTDRYLFGIEWQPITTATETTFCPSETSS